MTSKRRSGAGRGSRGMWGREAGEAAVWMAARPRGRRPACLGTSCSFGWWPRTCTKPERLPQPNDSRPVPKPGIPGERIRRGPLPCSFPDTHRPPLGLFRRLLALAFPLSQTTHLLAKHKEQGGPGSGREHTHLCSSRGPLRSLNLSLLWQQRRRRGKEENGSRMRKSHWESNWLRLGPGSWGRVWGWCLKTRTKKRERGRESPKTGRKTRECESSP